MYLQTQKGSYMTKQQDIYKENGYDIKILNLINPKNSDGYNPLFTYKK